MTKFAILNFSISHDHVGSIHAAGCKDIKRDRFEHAAIVYEVECETWQEARAHYIDDEMVELGYGNDDVRIHNCARKGKR